MVQTPSKAIALEEFLKLPETKPASEFIDGQIIQKAMPQGEHSRLQQKLIAAINAVLEDKKIALALPELRCTFGGRSVVPDVAVFTWGNIPTHPNGTIANSFNLPPDWAIEILSPDQSVNRVVVNLLYCLDLGSQMGWLIDPAERLVMIYKPKQQPIAIDKSEQVLAVPNIASELQLTLGQLFDWLKVR
ncbi:Uma2 family endonuclease [Tumidithrix elongata RA019]|uniref:Uma2 family endonuclease n=1 Tax=Tumidithrix elongata BACA0141 TaxID=2716417 RepID=A0AAW9Q5M8_9CYAN|nr:Uma2 family endonuclease [Tumidithrix elongata RA019]